MNHILFLALGLGLPFLLRKSLKSSFALFFIACAIVTMVNLVFFYPESSINGKNIAYALGVSFPAFAVGFFVYMLISNSKKNANEKLES